MINDSMQRKMLYNMSPRHVNQTWILSQQLLPSSCLQLKKGKVKDKSRVRSWLHNFALREMA